MLAAAMEKLKTCPKIIMRWKNEIKQEESVGHKAEKNGNVIQ